MNYTHLGPAASGWGEVPINAKKGSLITFMDSTNIQYCTSLERILYRPTKLMNPVMVADKPWEKSGKYRCVGGFSGKCIVVKGDKLQMFYSVYHMDGKREHRSFAYAESKDGYVWKKPKITKDGTNLLIDNRKHVPGAEGYYELQNVIYDEHSSQYIGLGHCKVSKTKAGTFVATTKDPMNWDKKNFKWLYKNDDIHALLGWDEDHKGYLAYIRVMAYQNGIPKRSIGISVSKDFKKWTDPVMCLAPYGGYNHQIYNMPVTKWGDVYLGFPINYMSGKNHGGTLDTGLVMSNNGTEWVIADRIYIPRGLPGEWDDSYVMTAAPIEWHDDYLFYFWGANFPHDVGFSEEKENVGSVGLAVLPKNRICSVACNRYAAGVLTIVPIQLPYNQPVKIVLNAHFPHGAINAYADMEKLAIVPKNNLEYYLVRKDGKDWMNGTVRLSLHLSDAEVFSIGIE